MRNQNNGFESIDPATEQRIGFTPRLSDTDVNLALEKSFEAFKAWKNISLAERSAKVQKMSIGFTEEMDALAALITSEMGKPIAESVAEIKKSILLVQHYVVHADQYLKPVRILLPEVQPHVEYVPVGPILGIMPWNFPLWQVVRFAIPNLLLGNTILLKHAECTQMSAAKIAEIMCKALGENPEEASLFQNLAIDHKQAAYIIADSRICGVSLTGSVRAGKTVAALAGAALKKTVLELGGSDPYIVLGDADVEKAVGECVRGRLGNSGQSCVAAKRWIVHESVYEEFKAKAVEALLKSENGVLARQDLVEELDKQVKIAVENGAKVLCGGTRPTTKGYYYSPTILEIDNSSNPVTKLELFGPVAQLRKFKTDLEAITIANETEFGLGGAVFSRDTTKANEIAKQVNSGLVYINEQVKSHPALPFGGVKSSGYGREMGFHGMIEFANIKTIWNR